MCIRDRGDTIQMMSSGKKYEVIETGAFAPSLKLVDSLEAGMVGYVAASIKNVKDTRVGDTITDGNNPADAPLPVSYTHLADPGQGVSGSGLWPSGDRPADEAASFRD